MLTPPTAEQEAHLKTLEDKGYDPKVVVGGPQHDYLSTACHHGLHERCRKTCKFCAAPCKCECHAAHQN